MEVFHDLLLQATRNDGSVVKEHNITKGGQCMSVSEELSYLNIPNLTLSLVLPSVQYRRVNCIEGRRSKQH